MKGYKAYKTTAFNRLAETVRAGREIRHGLWRDQSYPHILPLEGDGKWAAKRAAIRRYLGVRLNAHGMKLHPYVHHLNSSQLLCYMTFAPLLDGDRPTASLVSLLASLGVTIGSRARCRFEYQDDMFWVEGDEEEGTSFDFYISDGDRECFFEIKFTEAGFATAPKDMRHDNKIAQLYRGEVDRCPVLRHDLTDAEIRRYYQLVRNVIRCRDDRSTIVFITDASNPDTAGDILDFKSRCLTESDGRVVFTTWQEVKRHWDVEHIPMPFQFCCF